VPLKTLLLHPDDSPRRGPWARQKWDRIVDLGKSSESTVAAWQELTGSPVIRLSHYRQNIEDPRTAGRILQQWNGKLLDNHGLDWWDLTYLFVHSALETAIALRRLAQEVLLEGDLYATRSSWPLSGFAALLGRKAQGFSGDDNAGASGKLRRLSATLQRLNRSQIVEVLWDKYDADYRWRGSLAKKREPSTKQVVLLPSAYTNVSRGATAYAQLLPEQDFLLVATRNSALRFSRPANVQVARLEQFATNIDTSPEFADLDGRWGLLREQFTHVPEMSMLNSAGILKPIGGLIRSGLAVRDAWLQVLDREPITAVLCGDDSNWFTRIPVVLARKRKLPTLDFHHGAFDGRFLLKDLSSDFYLAKNEMERDYLLRVCQLPSERIVTCGLPPHSVAEKNVSNQDAKIVFFSEPYESTGGRPEETYRELLPPLYQLANKHDRRIAMKLHPFENAAERARLAEEALGPGWREKVEIITGPTTSQLLNSTWFGIAVESSAVVDCVRHNVPCFHCAWLVSTSFGYSEQYARCGVGRLLRSAGEIVEIPVMLANEDFSTASLDSPPSPDILRKLLTRQESPAMMEAR